MQAAEKNILPHMLLLHYVDLGIFIMLYLHFPPTNPDSHILCFCYSVLNISKYMLNDATLADTTITKNKMLVLLPKKGNF